MRPGDNFFRSERLRALPYQPLDWTWDELWQRLQHNRYRGALVGPHGSGKTTLLHHLADTLRHQGYQMLWSRHRLDRRCLTPRFMSNLTPAERPSVIVCVDGADLLPLHQWYWLRWCTRSCAGLLITTHRPGWLPTVARCRTSPQLLAELITRLTPDREAAQWTPLAHDLYHHHHGNLRAALWELYEHCAAQ